MKIIIIEDEKPAARRLKRMLEKQSLAVLEMLHTVNEAIDWFKNNPQPDLIFLDVQLGDGLSFEIFEEIKVDCPIVFTTAYDEYALQAFKLNSIDYLLKPIAVDELQTAIQKYKTHFQKQSIDMQTLEKWLTGEKVTPSYKTRFSVKVGQHLKFFGLEDIVCFYSENKGTYLHTFSNRDYVLETTLDNLQNELPPDRFFRINRSYFVNLEAIEDIVSYSNSRFKVKLKNFDHQILIVSRERAKDFKAWLG